jgi:glycosyltransferase involved in cell wall biosynthesis
MILFLRTSDISIDSRLLRYCRALDRSAIPHAVAFWARGRVPASDLGFPQFRFDCAPRSGRRRDLALHLLRANIFFMRSIWKLRARISLVHAVDLDTALSAWLMGRLLGLPYVFDVYDHYADSRGIVGSVRKWLTRIEALVVRDAAFVILADESRTAQHGWIPADRLLVVKNVPESTGQEPVAGDRSARPGDRLRIGYLGTFEPRVRGLEDLIAAVEADPAVELHIAGAGLLEEFVKRAASRCSRIVAYPPLTHRAGLGLLAGCDIVVGLYYPSSANHRYAAPNKYYEHLLVGRPLLTSKGTPPGRMVEQHDTGWAVENGRRALAAALGHAVADPTELGRKGSNAAAHWRRCFADYFSRKICGEYVGWVRRAGRRRGETAATGEAPCRG